MLYGFLLVELFCIFVFEVFTCRAFCRSWVVAEEEKGTSAWHRVPTWDGSPATWRAFKREMAWWTSSLNLEDTKKYNLVARWLLRQTGAVRARGEEFEPHELEYRKEVSTIDSLTNEKVITVTEDPFSWFEQASEGFGILVWENGVG